MTRYLRTHDPDLGWLIRHHLVLARKCGGKWLDRKNANKKGF
ncbi:hypothetical protein J2T58_000457 [Methanocalculus alkaliphilus]|nr:hypothetical protein [Methanocalculus alkaliphilus]